MGIECLRVPMMGAGWLGERMQEVAVEGAEPGRAETVYEASSNSLARLFLGGKIPFLRNRKVKVGH